MTEAAATPLQLTDGADDEDDDDDDEDEKVCLPSGLNAQPMSLDAGAQWGLPFPLGWLFVSHFTYLSF